MSGVNHSDAIEILPVQVSEIEALRHLSVKTFAEAFSAKNTPKNLTAYLNMAFSGEQVLRELNHPNSTFYFTRLGGETVGYLKLNILDGQTDLIDQDGLEIERIYVLSSYQGKRLGSKMIYFAIDQARSLGKHFVWLGVWQENTDAIRFYCRNGFKEVGRHPFMLGDDLQTDLLLKLDL